MSRQNSATWAVDSEWGFQDLRVDQPSAWVPVVFCATELGQGERLSFWGQDHQLADFIRDHAEDQFVAHNAIAEMKYLLQLGIEPPPTWFDTYAAWRCFSNRPGYYEAGLSHALHALGLPSHAPMFKEALRRKILELRFDPSGDADRQKIIDYCFSDCHACGELHRRLESKIAPELMSIWSHYLRAVARMELRGIPLDVEKGLDVERNRDTILRTLMERVNHAVRNTISGASPIFRNGSLDRNALIAWSRAVGIEWPTIISSATRQHYHPIDDETLKSLETRHPVIAMVRQVLKTRQAIGRNNIVVDPVMRRHYFDTVPFRAVTGRNQPKRFIFNGPKWSRHLIVPESPDHVLAYVDFVAQEFGIAAALSKDPETRSVYSAGDVHIGFAIRAGAAPQGATRESHPAIRKQYKVVNLGVLYGQTAFGIAHQLAMSREQAEAILAQHRELFSRFWDWSERLVLGVMNGHHIVSPNGWRSHVPADSEPTTWRNWPMQASAADMMRLFMIYLDRQNVRILAPVHDGFLISCRREQIADLQVAVEYARRWSVQQVIGEFPLRCETKIFENRFEDEDGRQLWNWIQMALMELHHE